MDSSDSIIIISDNSDNELAGSLRLLRDDGFSRKGIIFSW